MASPKGREAQAANRSAGLSRSVSFDGGTESPCRTKRDSKQALADVLASMRAGGVLHAQSTADTGSVFWLENPYRRIRAETAREIIASPNVIGAGDALFPDSSPRE